MVVAAEPHYVGCWGLAQPANVSAFLHLHIKIETALLRQMPQSWLAPASLAWCVKKAGWLLWRWWQCADLCLLPLWHCMFATGPLVLNECSESPCTAVSVSWDHFCETYQLLLTFNKLIWFQFCFLVANKVPYCHHNTRTSIKAWEEQGWITPSLVWLFCAEWLSICMTVPPGLWGTLVLTWYEREKTHRQAFQCFFPDISP